MLITMEQLAAFRGLAETGSFTKTAEKLFRTQPAISQAIRSMEEEMGVSLFNRHGRQTTLTQAGQIFFEHVEDAFDTLERGKMRIEALQELHEGELIISTSDTTAYYILPDVLMEFRNRYPGVDVRIHCKPSPVSAEQVLNREADIGIVTLPIKDSRLVSEPLIIREDVAICSPAHEIAERKKIAFQDLAEYQLILLDRGSNTRSYINKRFNEIGISPKVVMELGSIEVIKKLVQLRFGISIVPLISLKEELKKNTLKAIRIFKKSECRQLGIIYPAKGIASLAGRVFADILRDHLSTKSRL